MCAELSPEMVGEMRGWLMDCQWADVMADDIDEMPDAAIVRAVRRHYEGGLSEFIRNTEGTL